MNNFFATVFINNKACQYKVDELIQNSSNGYVNENFVSGNKNIYLPIQIKADSYYLQNKSPVWQIKCEDQEISQGKTLQHGDYLVFSKDDFGYSVLITEYKELNLSSVAYHIDSDIIFIGRSEEMNIVVNLNNSISRKCAAIRMDENGKHFLEDLSGKTGIYVNGEKTLSCELVVGDEIYIMGTTIIYYNDMLIVPSLVKTNNLKKVEEFSLLSPVLSEDTTPYVRTPRIIKSQEKGKIVIDTPPAPQKSKEPPFILTAGPSITMSLAMLASLGITISNVLKGGGIASLITSGVMAVSMLAGALLWPALLRRYNKKQEIAKERYRRKKYSAYLEEKEEEIKQKHERNARVLNENLMPAPSALATFIFEKNRRLWERVPGDEDFLSVRLGLGELDFCVEIQSPNKTFSLEEDPMIDGAVELKKKYEKMYDVPIALSLNDKKVVGVVGDIVDVFKIIVTNIVSLHSPDEVKLVLVYNSFNMKNMQWANDLPHVWSTDRRQRYVATNQEEAKILFSNLEEKISERESTSSDDETKTPVYVILVMDESLVEDVPFRRYLVDSDNSLGISTVFFGKKFSSIPKECVAIVQKDMDVCGMYIKNENNNRFINFVADEVPDELICEISSQINKIPIKVEKTTASVPDKITFLDMYRVGNVNALEIMNHWGTNSSDKSLAAPIGIKAGGETFLLDIHEKFHGCHGLVAGTTGSGKSEFLQAYILSMMVNYSPNEVAFVLVDFKGGDMARPFLKSPHLAATISNLSGNTLHRALISLEAEVKSRQNLFNRAAEKLGVDKIDINSYHKYFKDRKLSQPLPHLVIVIDEFAQLKSQHPEFMSKLVDIAQVGRSLGIHLILATQRPSGVIDPQIWSNSKFKVCLKVLDKQDSMDMISHPDAALIKQPGRAYVQVGYDEIFEQIQSGYSGADYFAQDTYIDEDSVSVSMVNWPAEKIRVAKKTFKEQKSSKTQLEEVMSFIAECGDGLGIRVKQLWLPPLPTNLLLEKCVEYNLEFKKANWDKEPFGDVVCGMADLPERQEQLPYSINFIKNGHLAIYGSSGTGKSTLIQSIVFNLALKYSPDKFNLFVMDFDGNSLASLSKMPHCSLYATDADEKSVENVINTIQNIITERREKFARKHCANYESFISCSNEKMPMILLVLDNYSAFREKMYRSEDTLVQLVSAARSCGIYFVVTGNVKGAIYYKVSEQISEKIVLNMNESGSYRDILNVSVPLIPEQAKGRALTVMNKQAVEVQLAVPFDTQNESERTKQIQKIYELMANGTDRVEYSSVSQKKQSDSNDDSLQSTSEAKMEHLESIIDTSSAIIIGKDINTKESKGFDLKSCPRVFIGTRGNEKYISSLLESLSSNVDYRVCLITSKKTEDINNKVEIVEDIDTFIPQLLELEEKELQKIVLVIDGFCEFFERISDQALNAFEKALAKDIKISIITLDSMQRINTYRDTGVYVMLVRTENGAVIDGGIDDSIATAISGSIYDVPNKFREKALKKGQGIVYSGNKIAYVKY